jgi:DNA-binding transcriptional regulator YdaS (Cro superfamily)
MKKEPFEIVVEKIGSRAALARLVGRPESTVKYWAKTGIPAEDAIVLEEASNGAIPRWMARPDLWDAPFREVASPEAQTPAMTGWRE